MPRRRTSTGSKIRSGTYRPSTARPDVELPPGTPRAPKWLEPEAKAEWVRVVRALSAAGALSEAHRSTLTVYAVLWGQYERARGEIPTPKLAELRRLTAELGISPRSGTVGAQPEQPAARPAGDNVTPLRGPVDYRALLAGVRETRPRTPPSGESAPTEPTQEPKP